MENRTKRLNHKLLRVRNGMTCLELICETPDNTKIYHIYKNDTILRLELCPTHLKREKKGATKVEEQLKSDNK